MTVPAPAAARPGTVPARRAIAVGRWFGASPGAMLGTPWATVMTAGDES